MISAALLGLFISAVIICYLEAAQSYPVPEVQFITWRSVQDTRTASMHRGRRAVDTELHGQLYPWQQDILDGVNSLERHIIFTGRKMGKTTLRDLTLPDYGRRGGKSEERGRQMHEYWMGEYERMEKAMQEHFSFIPDECAPLPTATERAKQAWRNGNKNSPEFLETPDYLRFTGRGFHTPNLKLVPKE